MAILITYPAKPNRRRGFEKEVRAVAPEIIKRQRAGRITSRDLAISMNADGVPKKNGAAWSYAVIDRMLKCGKAMGLPFILRSISQASSERRVHRRSKDEIARSWRSS